MFEPRASAELRQGDVCSVSVFPRWSVSDEGFGCPGTTSRGVAVADWDKPLLVDGQKLVCVCSYDCDLENPRMRSGVMLAPIVKIPTAPFSEEYTRIVGSWKGKAGDDGEDGLTFDYLNLFPLTFATNDMQLPSHAVVDFSAATTLWNAEQAVKALTQTKRFEMTEIFRDWFRKKLAVFYARPPGG